MLTQNVPVDISIGHINCSLMWFNEEIRIYFLSHKNIFHLYYQKENCMKELGKYENVLGG